MTLVQHRLSLGIGQQFTPRSIRVFIAKVAVGQFKDAIVVLIAINDDSDIAPQQVGQ